MTNEELAVAIQDGQTKLMETLLKQNEPLLSQLAWRKANCCRDNIADHDDFLQAGYVALMRAVQYYDRNDEALLTTYLKNTIKTEFRLAMGMHLNRKNPFDPCVDALRLDAPLTNDENADTFGGTIPDPDSSIPFEEVENTSLNEHVRETMDTVASEILTDKQREIYEGLLKGLRLCDMAEDNAVSPERIRQKKEDVLEALRGDPRILQLWLDVTEQYESVEEVADRFMKQVGAGTFREIGASSVEMAVDRILRNEHKQQVNKRHLEKALEEKLHEAKAAITKQKKKEQRKIMFSDLATFERGRSERMAAQA